jgi:hypothetical protein
MKDMPSEWLAEAKTSSQWGEITASVVSLRAGRVRVSYRLTMDLVFLHGRAAAGKLTTARALELQLGWPVFHNHQVVDLLTELFPFGPTHSSGCASRCGCRSLRRRQPLTAH